MICPMRTNQYGYCAQCEAERCAWWDIEKEQCCIKTLAIKQPKTVQKIEIEKEWGKDI